MALTLDRELPHPAIWTREETERIAKDPLVTEAIGHFLGHGRAFPPEILDEELLWQIYGVVQTLGPIQTALLYREHCPRKLRAQCRAVLMNLSRMKRENGGRYLWESPLKP